MISNLWTAQEFNEIFNISLADNWFAKGIIIDTRTLQKDDIFLAFKGNNVDGHKFVKEALESGAAAAIVEYIPEDVDENKCIVVDDVLLALEKIAKYARKRFQGKIIAVTGSVGKTTVKKVFYEILKNFGKCHCSFGNFNNHIGMPLSLARVPRNADYAVIEMGMNHAGEIDHLTRIAQPHIAAITTIDVMHIENLGSIEAIADAKSEIFNGLVEGGVAILPQDNENFGRLLNNAKAQNIENIITFGSNDNADIYLINYENLGTKFKINVNVKGREYILESSLSGRHNAMNILVILCGLVALNLDIKKSIEYFISLASEKGRGEIIAINDIRFINDSYNAGPPSMIASLKNIADMKTDRPKKAILADMKELGENSKEFHLSILPYIIEAKFSKVHLIGQNMAYVYDKLPMLIKGNFYNKKDDIINDLDKLIIPNDIVLLKGSNYHKLWEIIDYFKRIKVME